MNYLLEKGKFRIGCNYWASDVGINMWSEWNEDVVRKDFKALSEHGIRLLRVFPLWSVFQPIDVVERYQGNVEGVSVDGGITILHDKSDDAGINKDAFEHFGTLLDIAEEYKIDVIPSLITGWMSGRLFVPPAMMGKNLLCDPFALKWQARFCRVFVRSFRDRECIVGWDLGNECNCCAKVECESQAWLWTALLTDAIRATDNTRPILSGMHSLSVDKEGFWTMEGQGENCDMLTTHPYASPTYKTDSVSADNFRAVMHPACQSVMYSDISGKPCMIQETGTFGEMYCDRELTATYAKNSLINAWVHDCRAFLWWIGFDQGHLRYHPFGYNNRASNYGLMTAAYEAKPILNALKQFQEFLQNFEYDALPEAIADGVCLFAPGSASWPCGCGAFYLAKKAGMNLRFAYIQDELPDAQAYFIPSVDGNTVSIDAVDALMKRVKEGAVLYLSVGDGFLRNLSTDFGFHIHRRYEIHGTDTMQFTDADITLPFKSRLRYDIHLTDAKCLAQAADGTPIFTCSEYGKGKVFFLACPLEKLLFDSDWGYDLGHHKIYESIRAAIPNNRWLLSGDPDVTITEHPVNAATRIIVAVNNSPRQQKMVCRKLHEATLTKTHYGVMAQSGEDTLQLSIAPNDAVVFELVV